VFKGQKDLSRQLPGYWQTRKQTDHQTMITIHDKSCLTYRSGSEKCKRANETINLKWWIRNTSTCDRFHALFRRNYDDITGGSGNSQSSRVYQYYHNIQYTKSTKYTSGEAVLNQHLGNSWRQTLLSDPSSGRITSIWNHCFTIISRSIITILL
jgi:uncharacterized protein YeaC (DUF1315 family)